MEKLGPHKISSNGRGVGMGERCRIELFGGLRAVVGDTVVIHFRTRKTAALLAYLAFRLGRPCAREVLMEMLWPEAAPASGRGSLNTALSWLRQVLEPAGTVRRSVFEGDRLSIRMCPEAVGTDLQEFNESLGAARLGACAEEHESYLRRAVAAYTGELLTGFYESWIPLEQLTHSQRFIAAALELAAIHERRGEYGDAIGLTWRAVEADPLREAPYRVLMRLFEGSNEPASALAAYERFERVLAQELGATPSTAMRKQALSLKHRGREPHAA